MGPADRRPDPEPPPRGPCRRPAPAGAELSGGPDLRTGHGRTRTRIPRLSSRPRAQGSGTGAALDGRPTPARLDRPEGPLAGPRRRPARATRRWNVDQQRLDRSARDVRRPALPADRGHRAGDRSHSAQPRPAQGGPPESGPSRQPDLVDRCIPRRRAPAGRDRVRGRCEPVRPPRARDAGPDRGPRRPGVPDRSERERRGDARRQQVDPASRSGQTGNCRAHGQVAWPSGAKRGLGSPPVRSSGSRLPLRDRAAHVWHARVSTRFGAHCRRSLVGPRRDLAGRGNRGRPVPSGRCPSRPG